MKRSPFNRGKPLKAKTRMRPVSPKRKAYKASDEGKAGRAHMADVSTVGCLICGAPAEVHHLPYPRCDFRTVPLCPPHHKTEYGPQAYHYSRRNFNARHGSDEELLARTLRAIGKGNPVPVTYDCPFKSCPCRNGIDATSFAG